MSRIIRYITEVSNWLLEAKLPGACLLVLVAVVYPSLFIWHSEQSVRIGGYILQFIGMVFAVRGLLLVREHFGLPLLRGKALDWLKGFPRWKKNVVVGAGSVQLGAMGMNGHAEVWSNDDPEDTIEERLRRVLLNLDRLRDTQREHSTSLRELKKDLCDHQAQSAEERNKAKKEILDSIKALHTNDLVTSLVGLVWLTTGITLSTLAPEIENWIRSA